jgi:hypothetical protein
MPTIIEYQETTPIAFTIALFFCTPGIYVLLKKINHKNMAISYLDTKLASFYRDNDPIAEDAKDEDVNAYDFYYDTDVKGEILNARCYIHAYKNDKLNN